MHNYYSVDTFSKNWNRAPFSCILCTPANPTGYRFDLKLAGHMVCISQLKDVQCEKLFGSVRSREPKRVSPVRCPLKTEHRWVCSAMRRGGGDDVALAPASRRYFDAVVVRPPRPSTFLIHCDQDSIRYDTYALKPLTVVISVRIDAIRSHNFYAVYALGYVADIRFVSFLFLLYIASLLCMNRLQDEPPSFD